MNVSPTISSPLLQGAAQAATGEAVRAREFTTAKAIDPVVAVHQAALAKAGAKETAERSKKKKPTDDVDMLDDESSGLADPSALTGLGVTMSNETLIDAQSRDLMEEALELARIAGQSELGPVFLAKIPLVVLLEAQDGYEAVSSVLDEMPRSLYFKRK
ncbi:MAG: hypothetical protein KUG61_02700 [Parvibaculaceae bacterium]|nr:hypothetical protein [Parvibaculaceae bacterium]